MHVYQGNKHELYSAVMVWKIELRRSCEVRTGNQILLGSICQNRRYLLGKSYHNPQTKILQCANLGAKLRQIFELCKYFVFFVKKKVNYIRVDTNFILNDNFRQFRHQLVSIQRNFFCCPNECSCCIGGQNKRIITSITSVNMYISPINY